MSYLLPQLLDSAAERSPDREAARCGNRSLTYGELAERSSCFARLLFEEGVRPGDRVGIFREKGLESLVALWGAMKARAAYVPIDPLAPVSRLAFIVADCGIRHLVGSAEKEVAIGRLIEGSALPECVIGTGSGGGGRRFVSWEEVWTAPETSLPGCPGTELDLAYILYTSGSTGRPKGVMHTHRSALSFVDWAVEELGVRAEDRLSNHAPVHFDLSVFDFFAAAAAGAAVVVVPDDVARFPVSVADLVSRQRITIWYSVPFALIEMLRRGGLESRDLGALRLVLFAGEVFPPRQLRRLSRLLPGAELVNLYGPTETNVCTFHRVSGRDLESGRPIPIGRACANVELWISGEEGNDGRGGGRGELLVRAPSTMRGYWRRPELTADAFVEGSGEAAAEAPFYRTGDLVSRDREGGYHFHGRLDRQIKLRGFRIELSEIEGALLAHRGVEEVAVYLAAVSDAGDGERLLEATVVGRAGETPETQELVAHLATLLPAHAIPARFVVADELPRTSTGKVDRLSLEHRGRSTGRPLDGRDGRGGPGRARMAGSAEVHGE